MLLHLGAGYVNTQVSKLSFPEVAGFNQSQLGLTGAIYPGFPQISGTGDPNVTYGIEAATSLSRPIFWQRIGSSTASGSGLFQFTDTNAPAFRQRFYRALFP